MNKKDKQHAIRIGSDLYMHAKEIMGARSISNFSEYVRGLILIDIAHHSYPSIRGLDLPGWVTNDTRYIDMTRQANDHHSRHDLRKRTST